MNFYKTHCTILHHLLVSHAESLFTFLLKVSLAVRTHILLELSSSLS